MCFEPNKRIGGEALNSFVYFVLIMDNTSKAE